MMSYSLRVTVTERHTAIFVKTPREFMKIEVMFILLDIGTRGSFFHVIKESDFVFSPQGTYKQ